MKIVLMQKSFICADVTKNLAYIMQSCDWAKQQKASLLVTPYFALTGIPLFDIVKHDFLFEAIEQAIQELLKIKDLAILLTYPKRLADKISVCQTVIYNGEFIDQHVMDFQANVQKFHAHQFRLEEMTFGIVYSEQSTDISSLREVDIILYQSRQVFYDSVQANRVQEAKNMVSIANKPILVINPLGANDQYLYEGGSFALDVKGEYCFQANYFQMQDYVLHWDVQRGFIGVQRPWYATRIELLYRAIIFSLQEYLKKNNFRKICFGLSGGIDSALVLALSYQAVGAEHCEVFLMPSQYTSDMSNDLAIQMVKKLRIAYSVIPISGIFNQYQNALADRFQDLPEDITEENLQARIRGVLLMALSNKTGALLLCTGNKSEEAVGYCTLYGDTNGGFAPIKDLYKTEVYAMANWINQFYQDDIIPQGIIDRVPSAELKFNQSDQDSLPEYVLLDELIKLIVQNKSMTEIVEQGYELKTVQQVMKLVRNSEFKRQQGVLGPKISKRSFGHEWNYPITKLSNFF